MKLSRVLHYGTAMTALAAILTVVSCQKSSSPLSGDTNRDGSTTLLGAAFPPQDTPPPPGLVTVAIGSETLELWPFTGENFSGQGQDPINLIFFGNVDPRTIRAALLSLDGNRTGFGWPNQPPFNGEWQDAIGGIQAGFGTPSGWTGSAIQLACGDYHTLRFHLRLFRVGDWTVGNAHFELLIPGTADHQVLSWELAEQFVVTDLLRTGLLDAGVPLVPTQAINPSPFRTIPAIIYNLLPVPLRSVIGGPLGDVTADVPIQTDGHAVIFNVAGSQPLEPGIETENQVAIFNQTFPRPFCSGGPLDYVRVTGSIALNQINELTPEGVFISTFRAEGELSVTPVNPLTGEAVGETRRAVVREHHDTYLSDAAARASSMQHQTILPPSVEGGGSLLIRLRVNSNGANGYQVLIQCGDNPVTQATDAAGQSLVHAYFD